MNLKNEQSNDDVFWSPSKGGYYHQVNLEDYSAAGSLPSDLVSIPFDYYQTLLGNIVVADESGYPVIFSQQSLTMEEMRVQLLGRVASKRFDVEVGGIDIDGMLVRTDRESQAALTSAFTSMSNDLISSTPWKMEDGSFVTLTLQEIAPIAKAVAQHVRASFDAERMHCEKIATLTTAAQISNYNIEAGW